MAFTKNGMRIGMARHIEMRDFRQALQEPMSEREEALETIKGLMGADFHDWFNDVYQLRSAGKQAEYEAVIFEKLNSLQNTENEGESQEGIA